MGMGRRSAFRKILLTRRMKAFGTSVRGKGERESSVAHPSSTDSSEKVSKEVMWGHYGATARFVRVPVSKRGGYKTGSIREGQWGEASGEGISGGRGGWGGLSEMGKHWEIRILRRTWVSTRLS